jgi:hypothetical protein
LVAFAIISIPMQMPNLKTTTKARLPKIEAGSCLTIVASPLEVKNKLQIG